MRANTQTRLRDNSKSTIETEEKENKHERHPARFSKNAMRTGDKSNLSRKDHTFLKHSGHHDLQIKERISQAEKQRIANLQQSVNGLPVGLTIQSKTLAKQAGLRSFHPRKELESRLTPGSF